MRFRTAPLRPSGAIRPVLIVALLLLATTGAHSASDPNRFSVELEVGSTWQDKNDVQIPNTDAGTRFSLKELVGNGPWAAGRLYFSWNINRRHGLRLLLAPLSYTETGVFTDEVGFAGATFQSGAPIEATYKFNSWRVTYHYMFHEGERWNWWVGFTAKVRDAKIRLEQDDTAAEDTDLGFVPLLYLRGDWRFAERWRFLFDMDALGGGPGRAIDLSLKVSRDINPRWSVAGGYRTVEGGVDVDDVYNFAWFHFAVVSATYRF